MSAVPDLIEVYRSRGPRRSRGRGPRVTAEERRAQVLGLLDQGLTRKQVAAQLALSYQTVLDVIWRARRDGALPEPEPVALVERSQPKPPQVDTRRRFDERHAGVLIAALETAERTEYELEGVLPIATAHDIADEDADPDPIPVGEHSGCYSCWQAPGAIVGPTTICGNCPDPMAKTRCRADARRGLPLRT